MANYQNQPLYVYDEPVSYKDMGGGINTNPSNTKLQDIEMRDAVNFTYKGGALAKRPGAKVIDGLLFESHVMSAGRGRIQGIFTMPGSRKTHIVVIRDGLIYTGDMNYLGETLYEVPIIVDSKWFNTSDDTVKFDPENVVLGLKIYAPENEPDPLRNNEGYLLEHTVGEDYLDYRKLKLQNYKPVNGIIYKDELYLATGTRFLKIHEVEGDLKVEIVAPKRINAWEYGRIGFNYLSPFPGLMVTNTHELAQPKINAIFAETHQLLIGESSTNLHVVMDYQQGHSVWDYYFKWEIRVNDMQEWTTVIPFYHTDEDVTGRGRSTMTLDHADIEATLSESTSLKDGDTVHVRVTFTTDDFLDEDEAADYKTRIDKVTAQFGSTSVALAVKDSTISDYKPEVSKEFFAIHSCNKIYGDGNKFLLYGSTETKSRWYKTTLFQPNYISDQGGLDFQTTKNEEIIAVESLEGALVVFADNPEFGGSIHLVEGNGDDYRQDDYYSPYKRRLIHSRISCDHPHSLQYAENFLLFKYRHGVWMLDTRELNNERVNLVPVNHQINHPEAPIRFPHVKRSVDYEQKLFSYVTEDYYGVIFPELNTQWKLYFKRPMRYEGETEISFPWLRDISDVFNIHGVFNLSGERAFLLKNEYKFWQFDSNTFEDNGKEYKCFLTTKGFDATYPHLVKFLDGVNFGFTRGNTSVLRLSMFIYNEEGHKLFGPQSQAFFDPESGQIIFDNEATYFTSDRDIADKPSLYIEKNELGESKLGVPYFTTRLFTPTLRFPFMNVILSVEIAGAESFTLSKFDVRYTTTSIPLRNLPKLYREIIRKD